jgi:hypothetical protein
MIDGIRRHVRDEFRHAALRSASPITSLASFSEPSLMSTFSFNDGWRAISHSP